MALFAIGDLHLSLNCEKPMDVFGGVWEGYVEKIKQGINSVVGKDDVLVICGDFSWGMNLSEALSDFKFLDSFNGKKILLKGNHDYWWTTVKKMNDFLSENDIETVSFLHNNHFEYGEYAICGSRGWFFEDGGSPADSKKVYERELLRLKASYESAKARGIEKILTFLHYPPLNKNARCDDFINIMEQYGTRKCYYGHLHGKAHDFAYTGKLGNIEFNLISADFLNFTPLRIL